MAAEQAVDDSELSVKNQDDAMNEKILKAVRNLEIVSQGHTPCGSESEIQGNDDSRVHFEIMASNQYRKSPSGSVQNQLESKKNRDERMMPDFSNGDHNRGTDKGMIITKIKRSSQKKEIDMTSKGNESVPSYSSSSSGKKQKQTVATQVNEILGWDLGEVKKAAVEQELISPSSAGGVAMRVEFTEDKSGTVSDEWNNSKVKHTDVINGKENQSMRGDTQHEQEIPPKEVSFERSKGKEIHTLHKDQGFMDGNLHEGNKPVEESCPLKIRSEGSGASQSSIDSQSPLASQSHHTTQSSSSQSPYENQFLKEGYLPQQGPLPLSQLRQGNLSSPNELPQESLSYQQILTYRESQSSGSQSPSTQSPSSQSPPSQSPLHKSAQESHSPKRIHVPPNQSPRKVKSPQSWSPKKTHLLQRSQLPQRSKSPQKQSPKKSRSPKKDLSGVQGSEVSETDDEKMRNLSAWLHGRTRGRASTPSSSSVSISEHLQQSHSSWTKNQGRHKGGRVEAAKEEDEEVEELPDGSEIDLSDLEDFSLSGITLTNTSVPEDIHTPRDEDF